jgi:hypothetical protein
MDSYDEIVIGDKYKLPKGEYFWSIALQETVISNRDMVIKVDATTYNKDLVFGKLQVVFENYPLRFVLGDAAIGYSDKTHGDVHVSYKQLKPLK